MQTADHGSLMPHRRSFRNNDLERHLVLICLILGTATASSFATRDVSENALLASNLRHIGLALNMYMLENDMSIFPVDRVKGIESTYLPEGISYRGLQDMRRTLQTARWWRLGLVLGLIVAAGVVVSTGKQRPVPIVRKLSGLMFLGLAFATYVCLPHWASRHYGQSMDYLNEYVYVEGVRSNDRGDILLAYEDPSLRPKSARLAVLTADMHVELVPRADLEARLRKSEEQIQKQRRPLSPSTNTSE